MLEEVVQDDMPRTAVAQDNDIAFSDKGLRECVPPGHLQKQLDVLVCIRT